MFEKHFFVERAEYENYLRLRVYLIDFKISRRQTLNPCEIIMEEYDVGQTLFHAIIPITTFHTLHNRSSVSHLYDFRYWISEISFEDEQRVRRAL